MLCVEFPSAVHRFKGVHGIKAVTIVTNVHFVNL